MTHAYIFFGPTGTGKFEAALEKAREISGKKENQTREGIDPNLIILSPEIEEKKGIVRKKDIKVEKIREIIRKLNLTASGREKKVAIIRDAQKLTRSAQNALLKTLEEPPENCALILAASDKSKLLPTVLSRCQKRAFNPLSEGKIAKLLGENISNREEIIFWSAGRISWARELAENPEKLEEKKEMAENITLAFSGNVSEKFALAEKFSKNVSGILEELGLWSVFLRKKIIGENVPGYFPKISREAALEFQEEIQKSQAFFEDTNAAPRLILENLFLKI